MARACVCRAGVLGFDPQPRRREPSDYNNFRTAVKRERFNTLKHTTQNQENIRTPYKRFTRWNWIAVRSQKMELISSRMINSDICCKFEKMFPPK